MLPSQLPILIPRAKLAAGGSGSNPVIVQMLGGVVAKQRNSPSFCPLGYIRLPVWGGDKQMFAGGNVTRLIAIDHLIAIEG